MSKFHLLDILNSYSVEEFIEFLKNNGLGEFETLAFTKEINGSTFLNLAHFEINNWRPLIDTHQTNKFCFFLRQVKQSPEKFVFVTRTEIISKENIQKPSQNVDFLNSLRAAIENHAGARKVETRYSNNNNRSLPEIPRELSPLSPTNKHSPLRKVPSVPISSRETNQISLNKFQPFGLEDYFGKRKETELDLTRSIPQSSNRISQNDMTSNTEGICKYLPKPPKSFPKIDNFDSPMETRNYHRHTNWERAQELLSKQVEDGTYIIRPSKTYHSALSVKQGDKVYHIGVERMDDGIFEVNSAGLELKFRSLNEMIAYFKMHPISVRDKRNKVVDIYLNKALPFHQYNT